MAESPGFFTKSPHLKIGGLYIGSSMSVMHFTEMVFPAVHMPEWSVSLIIILALIGLPITILFSWAIRSASGNADKKYNRSRIILAVAASIALLAGTIFCYNKWMFKETKEVLPKLIGIYKGKSLNKTVFGTGSTSLDIIEMNPKTGKLRAFVKWYDGLWGEGTVYGYLSNEKLELEGSIDSRFGGWDVDIKGEFSNNFLKFSGDYRLFPKKGNTNGTQDGEFTLNKGNYDSPTPPDLIDAAEVLKPADPVKVDPSVPPKDPPPGTGLLIPADLAGYSKEQLKIKRNEIYARHGYIFKNAELKEYFSSQTWYVPRYEDVSSLLTDEEKANIILIKQYE